MMLWLGAAGVAIIAGLFFSFRIMRRGITTLDKARPKYGERIHALEQQIEKDKKSIPKAERLYVAHAGLTDLLRLADNPPGFLVVEEDSALLLHTPTGTWRIELSMNEQTLRSTGKVLHGRAHWQLSGFGVDERFDRLGDLMARLNACLRGDTIILSELPEFSRRFASRTVNVK